MMPWERTTNTDAVSEDRSEDPAQYASVVM